jgi:hypothetical protein
MAKRYTSTVTVTCGKEHTCVCCGAVYAYVLTRKAVGTGPTAARAQAAMQKRVQTIVNTETDMQACPTCGLYQPDMIGPRRAKRRAWIVVLAPVFLATVLILRAGDGFTPGTITWMAAGVCALVSLAHVMVELVNPNANLEANKQIAQQRVTEGKVTQTPGMLGVRAEDYARPQRSLTQVVALNMLLVSLPLVLLPFLASKVKGWPLNEACYPPVVGHGDVTRVYMPTSISSLKGEWFGTPTVALITDDGPRDGVPLKSVSRLDTWGQTIEVDSDSGHSSSSDPWVDFTMPDSDDTGGKTVQVSIDLAVTYPKETAGGTTYSDQVDQMHQDVTIRLAPKGAGAMYNSLWWTGTVAGEVLVIICTILLYAGDRALRRQAKATRAFAVK